MLQNQAKIIGIDLGGTQLRVVLSDSVGQFITRLARPTQANRGPEAVIDDLVALVAEVKGLGGSQNIVGLGIGIAAPVNPLTGILHTSTVLPAWHELPLRSILEQRLNLPVFIDNDANLGALGEYRFGAGKGYQHLVYLTISTGVGAGIVEDGRILRGVVGSAGELGHITVDVNGPACVCGNVGCLYNFVSGTALGQQAIRLLEQGRPSLIGELCSGNLLRIDAKIIGEAAQQGDQLALEIVGRAGKYLGIAVTNILHIFNPGVVVIGGGVALIGNLLFDPMREWVAQHAMPAFREAAAIVPAKLGDDAGLYGAVALALENYAR